MFFSIFIIQGALFEMICFSILETVRYTRSVQEITEFYFFYFYYSTYRLLVLATLKVISSFITHLAAVFPLHPGKIPLKNHQWCQIGVFLVLTSIQRMKKNREKAGLGSREAGEEQSSNFWRNISEILYLLIVQQ